jgi:protein-disulfide isomerase
LNEEQERERRREERLQADAEAEGRERRRKLLQLGSAAAFLAVVVILVAIVVAANDSSGGDAGNVQHAEEVEGLLAGIPQKGLLLGEPGAKVTLVEFGDLKCPFCKAFSEQVVPKVIESKVRGGEAKIEFRNYTIIDEQSKPAGAAAIAAGEQGRGWQFIELFYRNQGDETKPYVTDEFLTAIAKKAGVEDLGRWNRERRSKRVLDEVSQTTKEAEELGFEGTPSFAVEGPGSSGLETVEPDETQELEEAIENAS